MFDDAFTDVVPICMEWEFNILGQVDSERSLAIKRSLVSPHEYSCALDVVYTHSVCVASSSTHDCDKLLLVIIRMTACV